MPRMIESSCLSTSSRCLCLLVLLTWVSVPWAQTLDWTALSGGGSGVVEIADSGPKRSHIGPSGEVYSAVEFANRANPEPLVLKYSPTGSVLWTARLKWEETPLHQVTELRADDAGHVFVLGRSQTPAGVWLVALSSQDGTRLWRRFFGARYGQRGMAALATSETGALIAAMPGDPETQSQCLLERIEPATGALLWSRLLHLSAFTCWETEALEIRDEFIAWSNWEDNWGGQDDLSVGLIRLNDGTPVWSTVPQSLGRDSTTLGLLFDSQSNVILATEDRVLKLSAAGGSQVWSKPFASPAGPSDSIASIAIDAADDVYAFGSGTAQGHQLVITKYAGAAGAVVWSQRRTTPYPDPFPPMFASGIVLDGMGSAYMAATAKFGNQLDNFYALKVSAATGSPIWDGLWTSPPRASDYPWSIRLTSDGRLSLAGFSDSVFTPNFLSTAGFDVSTGEPTRAAVVDVHQADLDDSMLCQSERRRPFSQLGSDGSIIVGGCRWSGRSDGLLLAKFSSQGERLWETSPTASTPLLGPPRDAEVSQSGDIYVSLRSTDAVSTLLARISGESGIPLWRWSIDQSQSGSYQTYSVIPDVVDGQVLVVGVRQPVGQNRRRVFVAAHDAQNGQRLWLVDQQSVDASYEPVAVEKDATGNILVLAQALSYGPIDPRVRLFKFRGTDGIELWRHDPVVSNHDTTPEDLFPLEDGGFLFTHPVVIDGIPRRCGISRYDVNAQRLWQYAPAPDQAPSCRPLAVQLVSGESFFASSAGANSNTCALERRSLASGNLQWSRQIPHAGSFNRTCQAASTNGISLHAVTAEDQVSGTVGPPDWKLRLTSMDLSTGEAGVTTETGLRSAIGTPIKVLAQGQRLAVLADVLTRRGLRVQAATISPDGIFREGFGQTPE